MLQRKKKFGGYTVAGVRQKQEKNWGVQIVMALVVGVVFCGPLAVYLSGWRHISVIAIGITFAIDILLLLVIAWWALRTWDY